MVIDISLSLIICFISQVFLVFLLRWRQLSLGLPFAYLFILHLNHVPGALAHMIRPELFDTTYFVAIGIWQTAIASICFCVGVVLANAGGNYFHPSQDRNFRDVTEQSKIIRRFITTRLTLFCLVGGWFFIFVLSSLRSIASVGALIEKGGSIWMLAAMIGLWESYRKQSLRAFTMWLLIIAVYPTSVLIFGGFLSYGTTSTIIIFSIFIVIFRSKLVLFSGITVLSIIGLSVFDSYYAARDGIRSVVWSDASLTDRFAVIIDAFSSLKFLDFSRDSYALALNERLNQNFFSGLAASNIEMGITEFRYFGQFFDAFVSVIPRALWPDKPVFGGSGSIVSEMTGLSLSETTSWGVGQVMELYISFGWSSLILGFLILGFIFSRLDLSAAHAESIGDVRTLFICFLPAVALIQPIGSLVELVGGGVASYFIALGWGHLWIFLIERNKYRTVSFPRRH